MRVARVHAVPQPFDRAVDLARDRNEEVPVRDSLRGEPARRTGADIEGSREGFTHRLRAGRGGKRLAVRPAGGGVAAEPAFEFSQEPVWAPRGEDPGIVRHPPQHASGIARATQVHVGHVEHEDPPVETGPPWSEPGTLLPRAVGGRIELHCGPAASRLRRKPGGDVLPRQPRTLRGSVVEPEARGAPMQLGQRRHLARGHESLGKGDFQAIEAYGQHTWTRHRRSSGAQSIATDAALGSRFAAHAVKPPSAAKKTPRLNIVAGTTPGGQVETLMTTQVSVVIGTYNRAHLLKGTLDALASQEVPDSLKLDIVVVDNNSRDTTAQVVTAFSRTTTATPVRYVFEPQQGLPHARNRGVKEARGSIIAFTDDDVLPAPDWIAQIAAAIDRWSAHGVGGRILPRWEALPPRWLIDNRRLLNRIAVMDFEASRLLALPLEAQPQVWGANMAFRRELFERIGEFDPRRGIVGTKLFRGEDTDLINRALERRLKIAYDPALTVFHRIGSDRMRKAYFRKMTFDDAQVATRIEPVFSGRSFLGAPLWSYRVAFTDFWKWVGLILLRRPGAFDHQPAWWSSAGRLSGYWKVGP